MTTETAPLAPETKKKIEALLEKNRIVVFMKGTPQSPLCGFSAQAVAILNSYDVDFKGVNVLEEPDLRQGIKIYGDWPTVPQIYVSKNLIGGSDILKEMHSSGELEKALKS